MILVRDIEMSIDTFQKLMYRRRKENKSEKEQKETKKSESNCILRFI